jgi:hypothetical protein
MERHQLFGYLFRLAVIGAAATGYRAAAEEA